MSATTRRDVMADMWKSVMAVMFTIGEADLTQNAAAIAAPFARLREERWVRIQLWLRMALESIVDRRRGQTDGVQLANGTFVREADLSPEVVPLFRLLIAAQGSGAAADIERCVQTFSAVPTFRTMMNETAELLRTMYCPREALTMDKIWASFFSTIFRVAEEALGRGDITPANVSDEEPWLYLGLTGCAAMDAVLRSPATGPFRLALGDTDIDEANIPAEGRELFNAFTALRDAFHLLLLTPAELAVVRRDVLWAGRCDEDGGSGGGGGGPGTTAIAHERRAAQGPEDAARSRGIARVQAMVQGIAIRASQEAQFKKYFNETLGLLAAVMGA